MTQTELKPDMPEEIWAGPYNGHEPNSGVWCRNAANSKHVIEARYIRADRANPAQVKDGDRAIVEIKDRWKDRKWPSIGYFVHGQAYSDIQKLLEIIDGKQ